MDCSFLSRLNSNNLFLTCALSLCFRAAASHSYHLFLHYDMLVDLDPFILHFQILLGFLFSYTGFLSCSFRY